MYFHLSSILFTFINIINFTPPLKNDVIGSNPRNTLHGAITNQGVHAHKQHLPSRAHSFSTSAQDLSVGSVVHAVRPFVRSSNVSLRPSLEFDLGLACSCRVWPYHLGIAQPPLV